MILFTECVIAILFMCPCTCARHCTMVFCSNRTFATIYEHFINTLLRQVGRWRQRLCCIKPSQATISAARPVVGHYHIVHVGKRDPREARKKDGEHIKRKKISPDHKIAASRPTHTRLKEKFHSPGGLLALKKKCALLHPFWH